MSLPGLCCFAQPNCSDTNSSSSFWRKLTKLSQSVLPKKSLVRPNVYTLCFPVACLLLTLAFSPLHPSLTKKYFHPQQKPGKSLATLAQTQKKMYLHQIQNKRKDVCGRILTTRAFYEPAFPPFLTCFFKKIPHMGSWLCAGVPRTPDSKAWQQLTES